MTGYRLGLMAVVGLLLYGCVAATVTPTPGPAASPTAPASAPAAASTTPTPGATASPSPTAIGLPPLQSQPPLGTSWSGLVWSDPIPVNSPWKYPPSVLLQWQGQFIGISDPRISDSPSVLVASSTDLVNWTPLVAGAGAPSLGTLDLLVASGPSQIVLFDMAPGQALCGGCACGNAASGVVDEIWTSRDGVAWDRADTPVFAGANVWSVAGGPQGMVAVGDRGFQRPAIWFSATGSSWRELKLPITAFNEAGLSEVAAVPGGFVASGSVGGENLTWWSLAFGGDSGGKAAAWWSPDGLTWTEASVEPAPLEKLHFGHVYVAPGGLVSVGWTDDWQDHAAWTSTDGRTWRYLDSWQLDIYSRPWRDILVDGSRLLGLTSDILTASGATTFHLWESLDGTSWHEVALTGNAGAIQRLGWSGRRFVSDAGLLQQSDLDSKSVVYRGTAVVGEPQARVGDEAAPNPLVARPAEAPVDSFRGWSIPIWDRVPPRDQYPAAPDAAASGAPC